MDDEFSAEEFDKRLEAGEHVELVVNLTPRIPHVTVPLWTVTTNLSAPSTWTACSTPTFEP